MTNLLSSEQMVSNSDTDNGIDIDRSTPNLSILITRTEQLVFPDSLSRQAGSRGGDCGYTSEIFAHLLKYVSKDAEREGIDQIRVVNAWRLFLSAQGHKHEDIVSAHDKYIQGEHNDINNLAYQALREAFTLFKAKGKWYLADLTYCQFVDETSPAIKSGLDTGIPTNDQLIQQILDQGVIELTPESFRDFLLRNVGGEYHSKIPDSFTEQEMERVILNTPEYVENNKEELDQIVFE